MRTKILAAITFLSAAWLVVSLHNDCYFESNQRIKDFDVLQANLSSARSCVRSKAALDLQKLGMAGKAAVPQLVELLDDPDPSVRWRSVAALGYIRHFPSSVREPIYKRIEDKHETTRLNTLFAVSRMQFDPDTLVQKAHYKLSDEEFEVFLRGLSDQSSSVRYKALIHLSTKQIIKNGGKFKEAFQETLFKLTNDKDPRVEGMALAQLAKLIGLDAIQNKIPDYKSRIESFLVSNNTMVKRAAHLTMAELKGKTYPVLLEMAEGSADKAKEECDSGDRVYGGCYRFAELLMYQGKTSEALKYFKKDCGTGEQHPGYGCEILGDRALAAGDRKEAKRLYRRVASIHGTKNPSLIKIGDIYANDGDQGEACHWYLQSCLNGLDTGCTKAEECSGYGQVTKANELRAAQDFKKGQVSYQAAVTAEKKGDRAAARELYSKGHQSGFTLSTLSLASRFRRTGEQKEAIRILTEGCDTLEPLVCIRLGKLYRDMGDMVKAEEAYKKGCHRDRLQCSEYLAEFHLNSGNRSEAKPYLEYLCEYSTETNNNVACDKLEKIEEDAPIPGDLITSCNNGNNSDCSKLASIYTQKQDHERALEIHRKVCDQKKSSYNCKSLFDALWSLKRWDEYRLLSEEICSFDELACLRGATLDEHLNNFDQALASYEKLCFGDRLSQACGRIYRVAVKKYPTEELKDYFKRLCNVRKDIRSCGLLAALSGRDGDETSRDEYFTKAVKLAETQCATGDQKSCAGKALYICAAGKFDKGKKELQKLCDESSRFCRYVELCSDALNELLDDLVPRN